MKSNYDMVLFDLDGTLTDSGPGIFSSVKYALTHMGLPIPDQQTLRKFIGPPPWSSFIKYCGMTEDEAEQAVVYYRENYVVLGAFQNNVYPHVMELLNDLKATDVKLSLATSKPYNIARPILDYFKLTSYFDYISAPYEDEHSSNKKELILSALQACKVSKERAVMIGDTHYDTIGAQEAETNFIGVLYGFGTQEEMEQKGGRVFVRDPAELKRLLLHSI